LKKEIVWRPQPGPQTEFSRRTEDVGLYGGSKGGGKSDELLAEATRQTDKQNYKALLIRRTFPQLQDLIDRAHILYPKLGGKWIGGLHRYTFKSGAFIQFGHCQHERDKENYQGHEYAFIGLDQLEQFTESQFNFLSAQNRTSDPEIQCYIRATANPGGEGHWWIKRRFIDGKTPGKTYKEVFKLPDGRQVSRTFCYIRATIYDNPILLNANPTYLATLESLPEPERSAYLLGDWNAFTTQCIFDKHGMRMQETKVREPEWVGWLKEIQGGYRIVTEENGPLSIWLSPEEEADYEIGADVAEGDEGGDYSAAYVVNKRTWEVVAIWYGQVTPFEFAVVLDNLGRYYNQAEIAVEKPGPGASTVEKLQELRYPLLFKYDRDKVGFLNNVQTRSNLISTFIDAVKDGSVKVRDRATLDEMYNFIRNPRTMKIEAREGCHDDRVMGLGITLQCIRINPYYEPGPREKDNSPIISQSIVPRRDMRRRMRRL
jgi:hypothetical protein